MLNMITSTKEGAVQSKEIVISHNDWLCISLINVLSVLNIVLL